MYAKISDLTLRCAQQALYTSLDVASNLAERSLGASEAYSVAQASDRSRRVHGRGALKLVLAKRPKPPCPPRTAESSVTFTQLGNRITAESSVTFTQLGNRI